MKKIILALMLIGTVGYSAARITNADIAPSAAIALNKLAASTANRVPLFDASGFLTPSSVTNTILGYVDFTSSGQTQLNAKQPLDADLTALAALAGTDNIYYRSAADTWTSVTVGSGLSFSSGTLTASGGGTPVITATGLINVGCAISFNTGAATIALKQADGSTDPASGSGKVTIPFRNTTATTGGFTQRDVTGSLSITLSSGSTLGFASGVEAPLYVYAIDNAGTVELAVSGFQSWDEGTLQSTTAEGGSGGADAANVLYSTTARTSKPIAKLCKIVSTQTTAGTWAQTPTTTAVAPFTGRLGENYYVNSGAVDTYTNNQYKDLTNLTLPAGTWQVNIFWTLTTNGGALSSSETVTGMDTTSGNVCGTAEWCNSGNVPTFFPGISTEGSNFDIKAVASTFRVSSTASATYYSKVNFSNGSNARVYSSIRAWRVKDE